ncbi:protein of unknown function [Candidatus Hydrogenisulfobacillus filiaventi]|uniref:Uncharacterized protein n=1 Tax=Candidatus Hydrogenisulfobacillus filiaventi TaxID=2707344 RepID=A0A6F8ZC50_9FIRM|nr:protein of unknown function [Candidatus Hydrogenisulfobacillus filiaventi]
MVSFGICSNTCKTVFNGSLKLRSKKYRQGPCNAINGKRTAFRPPRISKSGGSSLEEKLPPVIVDLLREVPPVGEEWPGLKEWMDFFAMAMRRYYGDKS